MIKVVLWTWTSMSMGRLISEHLGRAISTCSELLSLVHKASGLFFLSCDADQTFRTLPMSFGFQPVKSQ